MKNLLIIISIVSLFLLGDFCYRHRPYFERSIVLDRDYNLFGFVKDGYDFCDRNNSINQQEVVSNTFFKKCFDFNLKDCGIIIVTSTEDYQTIPCYKSVLKFR